MESVSYPTSGALNRAHYALVAKIENASSSSEAESAILGAIYEIRQRVLRGPGSGLGRFEDLARGWGVHLPTAAVWDPAKAREDLLLLLYCKTAGSSKRINAKLFEFAIPLALTLAEGGTTIAQRRAGYLYCTSVIPSGHEMQLMIVNTLRKDLESTSVPRVLLSLDTILSSPTEAVIPAIANRLEDLLAHSSASVRQRALLGFAALAVHDSELLTRCIDKLPHRLQDPETSVRAATLDLLFVCFQNEYVDAKEVIDVATAILKGGAQKKFRDRRKGGVLIVKALAILEHPLGILLRDDRALGEAKIQELCDLLLTIGQVACQRRHWGHLLSVLRALGNLPFDVLIHHLVSRSDASPAPGHPLAFIRPVIHETDPNVLYTLLSGLRSLPTAIWAGTAPTGSESGDLIGKSDELSESLEPSQPILTPTAPTTADPFRDDFGPFEGGSASHSPDFVTPSGSLGLSNVSTSPRAVPRIPHLPPLFEEEEVGVIVGFLRSEDSMLRKDTLRLLFSADSSEHGVIRQYLGSLLEGITKVAQEQAKGGRPTHTQLQALTCRALEAADVLVAGNGETYASEIDRVLLEAEGGEVTEEGVKPSSKANVLDGAVEMVLIRLRDATPAFQQTFTDGVLRNLVAYPKEVASRRTLVTLCATVACQYGSSDVQLDQQVVNALGQTLTMSPASIQEVMLLAMLRTIAREGVSAEPVLPVVRELRASSGRHISNRCAQFLDLASDLPCLRKLVATIPSSTLPDFLGIIEVHTHATRKGQSAASKSVRAASASSSPQVQVKKEPSTLRYAAYGTPPSISAQQLKPKRQESFNSLESYTTTSHNGSTLPVIKNNWHALSPDIVDLARSVAGGSSRSVSPVVRRQDSGHPLSPPKEPHKDLVALESPFHDRFDKSTPPFATKSRSPPFKSGPLSPSFTSPKLRTRSPLQRSTHIPFLSASSSLSGLQNPGVKVGPTPSKDEGGRFDVLWNQLGSPNKSGIKGWSEKGVYDTLDAARGIPNIDVMVRSDTGVEVKSQLQLGLNIGLLKLRADEDGGCVWSLRSTDETLRRMVRAQLD